jgi:hypothetical protein
MTDQPAASSESAMPRIAALGVALCAISLAVPVPLDDFVLAAGVSLILIAVIAWLVRWLGRRLLSS